MTHSALTSLDESSYHPRLAQTPGIAVVLFSSPACGTCRMVERRLPEAAPAGTHLFKVDVQQATALARAFEIFHLPELFLYSEGRFHARLGCEISAQALGASLDRALAQPAEEEP
jgi:thioredoxin 1